MNTLTMISRHTIPIYSLNVYVNGATHSLTYYILAQKRTKNCESGKPTVLIKQGSRKRNTHRWCGCVAAWFCVAWCCTPHTATHSHTRTFENTHTHTNQQPLQCEVCSTFGWIMGLQVRRAAAAAVRRWMTTTTTTQLERHTTHTHIAPWMTTIASYMNCMLFVGFGLGFMWTNLSDDCAGTYVNCCATTAAADDDDDHRGLPVPFWRVHVAMRMYYYYCRILSVQRCFPQWNMYAFVRAERECRRQQRWQHDATPERVCCVSSLRYFGRWFDYLNMEREVNIWYINVISLSCRHFQHPENTYKRSSKYTIENVGSIKC